MKSRIFRRITAFLCAGMLCVGAAGAQGSTPVTVTLDGTPLSFAADAGAITEGGRTYVPFRAIFEAMGATVSWNAPTQTVSATRDGTVVQFVVGQRRITVAGGGEQRIGTVDAASFLRGGTTYVPVRFAAEAFGAAVGWDAQAKTVLLVDTAKQKPAGDFHIMNRYLALLAPQESRAISGDLKLLYTVHAPAGEVMIPMTLTFSGTRDALGASGTVRTVTDIRAMTAALAADKNAVPQSVVRLLTTLQSAAYDIILSRPDSTLYLRGASLGALGVADGAWVGLPLDSTLRTLTGGKCSEAVLAGAARNDFAQVLCALAAQTPLTDAAADNVAAVRTPLDAAAARYADTQFTARGGTLLHEETRPMADGSTLQSTLRLTEGGGAITVAAHEQTLSHGEQLLLQRTRTQDSLGALTDRLTIRCAAYDAALTLTAAESPAATPPLRRP